MTEDKSGSGRDQGREGTAGEKALEGARGGVVIPIQTAPLDITNQVGGLPPADSPAAPDTPAGSVPSGAGEE
jgi:hypothetical protein